jgi:hypothetical protein
MNSLWLRDRLFRLGLYRGIPVQTPSDLIICTKVQMCPYHWAYQTSINLNHHLTPWLYDECLGPWAMRMRRPLYFRQTYLVFARHADALTFRLLL